jgi:hypothetical protein
VRAHWSTQHVVRSEPVWSRQIWSQLEPVLLPLFAYGWPLVPLMFFTLKCEFMDAMIM